MAFFRVSSRMLFPCLVLLLGCQVNQQSSDEDVRRSLDTLKVKIATLTTSNLDSALHYSNLAIRFIQDNQLGNNELLYLQLRRSELFDQMGLRDSAEQTIAITEVLLQSQEDPYQKAIMNFCKGIHLFAADQYQDAEIYLQEAGAYFLQNPKEPKAGKVFQELANFYTKTGQLTRAHDFLLKAAAHFSSIQDSDGTLAANIQLATIFRQQELQAELSGLLEEILSSLQQTGAATITYTQLQQLGFAAAEALPDSALAWQQVAAREALQAGDTVSYYLSLTHINAIVPDQNKLEEAAAYFDKTDHPSHFILASSNLGKLLLEKNELDSAKSWLDRALEHATALENPVEQIPVLTALQQWYLRAGKKELFGKTQDNIQDLKQDLAQKNAATTLEFLEKAQLLEQVNHQKTLLATKLEQQQRKIRFRNGLILAMGLGVFILGIGAQKVYQAAQRKKIAMQVLLESYKTELLHLTTARKSEPQTTKPGGAELKKKLLVLFEQRKIFLQPGLKVEEVTEELGISYKDFNQLLKEEYGTNFKNFINAFRVDHAKSLLLDPNYQHLTVEGVGLESGFGTKQSFYTVFQQALGVSPGEYKDIIQHKTQAS